MPSTTTSKKKALIAKEPRKKKLRLSIFEQRLLEHPPTTTTWQCSCEMVVNGKLDSCWVCGKEKQAGSELYTKYEELCKRVGIEPGVRWKITDKMRDTVKYRPRKGRWTVGELPEGYTL